MTTTTPPAEMAVLKTDSRNRVLVSRQQRDAWMSAFEHSGMSGAAFARLHGIRYSTFANWRKNRAKKDGAPSVPLFEELTLNHLADSGDGLRIDLPGGAYTRIARADQIPSAVALLKYLEASC
jgi:hypothetical protein